LKKYRISITRFIFYSIFK